MKTGVKKLPEANELPEAERLETDPPLAPSEEAWPYLKPGSGLLASRTEQGDNKFLLLKSLRFTAALAND